MPGRDRYGLPARRQSVRSPPSIAGQSLEDRGTVKIFTAEHEMFREVVRAFVEKEVAPHVEEWEAAGRMPKALWRRMGELGFFGLEYDEKYGGSGADVEVFAGPPQEGGRG